MTTPPNQPETETKEYPDFPMDGGLGGSVIQIR